ncbi:hypothetical protein AGMMS50276_13810 [Synergistales bacterium]|nr:hypothetical protein AGMMS50276_13810 [Synergistales bacterium]
MLTIEQIKDIVPPLAEKYKVAKVDLFGSYASDAATEDSDADFLVTFIAHVPSIFAVMAFREEMSKNLNLPVDVVTLPLARPERIKIGKVINIYEQP